MEIKTSIIDYLGTFEGGIFVRVGLMMDGDFYEGMFYYTTDKMLLTVDEPMIKKMGMFIEEREDYVEIMRSIISSVEPYDSIVDKLSEIDIKN